MAAPVVAGFERPSDPMFDAACFVQRQRGAAVTELRAALRLRPNYPAAEELLHELER